MMTPHRRGCSLASRTQNPRAKRTPSSVAWLQNGIRNERMGVAITCGVYALSTVSRLLVLGPLHFPQFSQFVLDDGDNV